jgi:stearoyl-CoA desaturase (delta-9 desaturase)
MFVFLILGHFFASLFLHSFFLHRYGTHHQFTMTKKWERSFFFLTWLFQGSSFLNPKSYARMHLEHHAHSDTPDDPHSPLNFSISKYGLDFPYAATRMMYMTKKLFAEIRKETHEIASMYKNRVFPEWRTFEKFADSKLSIIGMGALMVSLFALFASGWEWLLLPLILLNGAVQGAIVNWCGHMWGYRNYDLPDNSKNTWILSSIMWGELFQNNHHKHPDNPNFGGPRWYEIDPLYPVLLFFKKLHIISFKT